MPADAPRLVALQALAFGVEPTVPFLAPGVMHWKYWERREDWTAPRSFVIERTERLVAHAAVWPARLPDGGSDCQGAHIIDWAADPTVPGAGIAMLQRICKMFDFIYAIGGTRTARAVVPAFGFREVGRSWRAGRPIRPLRQAMASLDDRRKAAPRLARNLFWSKWPASRADRRWSCQRMADGDVPALPSLDTYLARPPGFFKYLSLCPASVSHPYRVHDGRRWRGFFLLVIVRHQARVALWLDEATREDVRIAYLLAQKAAFAYPNVYEVSTMSTSQLVAEAAVDAGLRIRQIAPVHLLPRLGFAPDRLLERQLQITDSDAAFLDDGGAEFLC